MGISNIGIVVENDYKEILYYENSFIIDINVSGKDLRATIESKLEEILEVKAFRIESVYKKIAKISISSEHDSENNILMYLVKVDMYSDNSDFMDREEVLGSITSILYRDYFIKYFIRYDKYNELVNSFINMIFRDCEVFSVNSFL